MDMEIRDYREASDALLQLNQAALSLVRVNWDRCPWAKDMYEKTVRIIDELKPIVFDNVTIKHE